MWDKEGEAAAWENSEDGMKLYEFVLKTIFPQKTKSKHPTIATNVYSARGGIGWNWRGCTPWSGSGTCIRKRWQS